MIYNKKNIWTKFAVVCFATASLIATGDGTTSSDVLSLSLSPNDTISTNKAALTVTGDVMTLELDANNKARANTQYYDKASGQWKRLEGHTIVLSGSAKITGSYARSGVTLTELSIGKGSPNKVSILLNSATEVVNLELDARELSAAQLAILNTDINALTAEFDTSHPTPQEIIDKVKPILEKNGIVLPDDITSLITDAVNTAGTTNATKVNGMVYPLTYSGTKPNEFSTKLLATGGSVETGGLYGGFGIDGTNGKQLTGFYAKAAGTTHIASSEGKDATYDVGFAGAGLNQNDIARLEGSGKLNVDFGTGKLKTDGDGILVNSYGATFSGGNKLSFELTYDAADKLFKSDSAKYTPSNGGGVMSGNAEAAIFENAANEQSVLGSVDLRDGDNVIVGGFGNRLDVFAGGAKPGDGGAGGTTVNTGGSGGGDGGGKTVVSTGGGTGGGASGGTGG